MQNREQVKMRRMVNVMSVLGGILIYIFTASQFYSYGYSESSHSFFFGDMSAWPAFVRDFWPLDMAGCCVFFWLAIYISVLKLGVQKTFDSKYGWLKVTAGGSCFFGALAGAMSSGGHNWFIGIEAFLLFSGGLFCMLTVLFSAGYACVALGKRIDKAVTRLWGRIRHWKVFRPLIKLSDYMQAKDIDEKS